MYKVMDGLIKKFVLGRTLNTVKYNLMAKKVRQFIWSLLIGMVGHVVRAEVPSVSTDTFEPASVSTDTFEPVIENYFVLTVPALGYDFLHEPEKGEVFSFQFDWRNLFRLNTSFLYAIRIGQSRWAFCAGVGVSALHYTFKERQTRECRTLRRESENSVKVSSITEADMGLGQDAEVLRSTFSVRYFDVLLRLRSNSVLSEPTSGFHFWGGVKLSVRMNASSVIQYKEHGETITLERTEGFNMHRLVGWVQGGIGYSRFGLTGAYAVTPLFEARKGPGENLKPWSIGLYIDLF